MVSSQKERDFDKQNFDDMKRVFSIWLCMNMPSNSMSYVHLTKEDILEHYNWNGHLDLLNIVLLGIGRELPPQEEQYELHRLIGRIDRNTETCNHRNRIPYSIKRRVRGRSERYV